MTGAWIAKAEKLSHAMSHAPSGGKLLQIEQLAQEFELSHKTIQQLLQAHDFLERLRSLEPETAFSMSALPYQAVLALERWYSRDRDEVLNYLKHNPAPSVRTVIAAEKSSRGSTERAEPAEHALDVLKATTGLLTPGKSTSKMLTWAGVGLFGLEILNWQLVSHQYERALGIEYDAAVSKDHRLALLVGPNSPTIGHYTRHAKAIWNNAVCATSLYPIVIMLLPSKAALSACLVSMPLPPSGDGNWPDWNTKSAPRGQPRSGPMRPASPKGGIVFFTTPESIGEDWRA